MPTHPADHPLIPLDPSAPLDPALTLELGEQSAGIEESPLLGLGHVEVTAIVAGGGGSDLCEILDTLPGVAVVPQMTAICP